MDTQTLMPATTIEHLSDVELLALTLGHVSMRRAARLLARFHDLDGIARASPSDFELERMTVRRAMQLQAAFELGRRSLGRPLKRGALLDSANAVQQMLGPRLSALEQEELHALGLDNRSCLVTHFVAAKGTRNEVHVCARDIFRHAVRENCCAVIVVHNHPSGDVEPSLEDKMLTAQLRLAGDAVGVPLVDHVIVGRHGCFSFNNARMLDRQEFGH